MYRQESLQIHIGKGVWPQVLNNLDTAISSKVITLFKSSSSIISFIQYVNNDKNSKIVTL